jgi:Acyclic terpene utilisation family protein AtuA
MSHQLRVGAGSGFWGDAIDPALELVERGRLDYLGLDYLAELTMALLHRMQERDPHAGFIPDMAAHMRLLLPPAKANGTRVICNGGGVNPMEGGQSVLMVIKELGLDMTVGVVAGDDLMARLTELRKNGVTLANLETGNEDFDAIQPRVVAANAYTGADGIVEALRLEADVVVAGRVADSSLFVAPMIHEFGWTHSTHVDHIAAGIVLGHIVECAAGCTGGMSSRFDEMPNMGFAGFPVIEVEDDGSAIITKLEGTGGAVDQWTVKEHLVYETVDPTAYLAPDGVADFTTVRLKELGPDRVGVTGVKGRPRPADLKLVIAYEDGWIGEGILFFPWPNAVGRAEKARQTLCERFERLGLQSSAIHFDLMGINMLHGPGAPDPMNDPNEVGLRVAVRTSSRAEAEKVRRACSQLWIMGPGGTSLAAPIKPRPVVSLWPTTVPRTFVNETVTLLRPNA